MARASRHYIPGFIWHITHRCHKRDFLLKFRKDRHRWTQWVYQARKRYGLEVLSYMVTSNHIHLLVLDSAGLNSIPRAIQLIAGRTAQEYNQRKRRQGAFWEDRYHAVAIESGEHLVRCLVYIDMNMVRAGVVSHPSEWEFCGYNEIRKPRRKCILISYEPLFNLAGYPDYESFRMAHRGWIQAEVAKVESRRMPCWSESLAVGSEGFVEDIQSRLAHRARGRRKRSIENGFELRESSLPYNAILVPKKTDIGV